MRKVELLPPGTVRLATALEKSLLRPDQRMLVELRLTDPFLELAVGGVLVTRYMIPGGGGPETIA